MLSSIYVTFPSSLPFVCSQAVSSYKGMFIITGFLQITILTLYKTSIFVIQIYNDREWLQKRESFVTRSNALLVGSLMSIVDLSVNIATDRFLSRGQQLCKFLGTKGSFYMRKQFNHHRPFLVHKHGRRSIVLYISMAAVTSCENDLPPFSPVVPRTAELPRLQLFPFLSIFVKLTSIKLVTVFNAIFTSRQGNFGAVTKLHTNLLKAIHPTSNSQRFLWLRRTWRI